MQAKEPLGVFQQISDKRDPQGSTYRVLGLGMIVNYDEGNGVFVVENVERKALAAYLSDTVEDSERSQVELYALALGRFEPHIREEQSQYLTNAPKRDQAFRRIVMEQYDYSCAVCQMKFKLDTLIEATAAHIIAKQANGTDDPRNGLGLCRLHHWAFDAGLFTLSDDLEILVSPEVRRAETHEFDLLERERSPIAVPQDDLLIPHPRAIQWHREKVWRA
jgi:predicted restriction endonuclease